MLIRCSFIFFGSVVVLNFFDYILLPSNSIENLFQEIKYMNESDFANFLRDTQGRFGTNRQQFIVDGNRLLSNSSHVELAHELLPELRNLIINNYKCFDLEELRNIANLLLDNGANPNATYDINGIKGYTPFLYACELDESELVAYMLNKPAVNSKNIQANKTIVYRNLIDGTAVDYKKICEHFKSYTTLEIIEKQIL